MKYKYFLRGFGFGILFATLMLMCSLAIKENMPQNNSSNKNVLLSDVKETEKTSKDEDKNDTIDNKVEDNSDKNNETSAKEEDEKYSEESSDDNEENATGDSETSKREETSSKEITSGEEETSSNEVETTSKEEESSSEVDTDIQEETSSVEMVVFTLSAGMSSNQVAQALNDLGVVASASEFNSYMENNGIAKRLRIGVYQIPKNASYSEIGNILLKKN